MKKNVWIFNHYAGDMYINHGGRHYSFAKYLKRNGYNPVVFCANSKHGIKEVFFDNEKLYTEVKDDEIGVPFVFVKCGTYENNGKDRIKAMFDFFINVQKASIKYSFKNGKPDIIYASSVHPLTLIAGLVLAKLFKVKCICEIRDLWPESIVAYSSKWTKKNPLIKILYKGEKWIYKRADFLIYTMEGAYQYIIDQGWEMQIPREKVYIINNGVDLETFNYNASTYFVEDSDLLNNSVFKVVYAGSIRTTNGIDLFIDAAKLLKGKNVIFLIWGKGDLLGQLENYCKENGISNVIFKGSVDKKYIPYIVSHADANLVDRFDGDLSKYGISANKLFDYFAAGKPIIMSKLDDYNPASKSSGTYMHNNTPEDIYSVVEDIMSKDKDFRKELCNSILKLSEEYSYEKLTMSLIDIIER